MRPALRPLTIMRSGKRDDDPIPVESARSTASALRAEFIVIPNCGHVPYVEAPDEFVRHLDPFLPRE